MKEIRANILECYENYQLVMLPMSLYQKKFTGAIVVDPNSFMSKIVEKFPDIPILAGRAIERMGSCPSIFFTVKDTRYPTKFLTFPISPSSLRIAQENVEKFIVARLSKNKQFQKPYTSLIPGWCLRCRTDIMEFSLIKSVEIINYFKLTEIAFIIDCLGLDEQDEEYYQSVVRDMFFKYFGNLPITLMYLPKQENKKEEVQEQTSVSLSSSYEEDSEEDSN